jgi:hypothetical protein
VSTDAEEIKVHDPWRQRCQRIRLCVVRCLRLLLCRDRWCSARLRYVSPEDDDMERPTSDPLVEHPSIWQRLGWVESPPLRDTPHHMRHPSSNIRWTTIGRHVMILVMALVLAFVVAWIASVVVDYRSRWQRLRVPLSEAQTECIRQTWRLSSTVVTNQVCLVANTSEGCYLRYVRMPAGKRFYNEWIDMLNVEWEAATTAVRRDFDIQGARHPFWNEIVVSFDDILGQRQTQQLDSARAACLQYYFHSNGSPLRVRA